MTCSKRFGRLLQASCLALIGTLTIVGCGGSDTKKNDAAVDTKPSQTEAGPSTGLLKVTPALLDFGRVDVGATSTAQPVTVTVSVAAITISPTVTGAGFIIAGTTCAASQAPGNCTISVAFAPTTIGGASGSLVVGSGVSVSLSGTGNTPGVFTAPDRIDLGSLKVGATAAVAVTITPQGTLPGLTCTSSNSELALNAGTTTCSATAAISAPCVYGFTFTASTAGAKTDTVTCVAGTGTSTKTTTTTVAASVVGPSSIAVSENTAQFSAVAGKTDSEVITISNNGQSATAAAPVVTITSGTPDFSISSSDCVVALAPLSTCKVTVTYSPTAAGTKTGALSVADGTTVLSVALNGSAITDRSVSITPSSPDFGSVTVGESKPTTFTMKNAGGTATGVITLSGSTDEFKIGSDQCSGAVLAPTTGSCTFVVTFAPAGLAGARSTIINASDTAGPVATAKLSGTAVAQLKGAILSITPPTLDFGTTNVATQVGPKVFTITNTGDSPSAALSVVKNDVSGAAQFTVTSTCASALDPAATCQVAVTFAPTIKGNASATITVTDGLASTKASTVVGTALDKGTFTVKCAVGAPGNTATSSFDYPTPVVVSYSSTTVATCQVSAGSDQPTGALTVVATDDFAVPAAANKCGASLDPGSNPCTFNVTFTPTAAGARTGTFTVTGANGGVVKGSLTGTGLAQVQLIALGATDPTGATPATGLDLGQAPNGAKGNFYGYRAVVRGAGAAGTSATSPTITLNPGTPADFIYVNPANGTALSANPCAAGSTLAIPASAGPVGNWATGVNTKTYPAVALNTAAATMSPDGQLTAGYWTCDFYVQFFPQSGKSATAKSATVVVAGSNTLTITGVATGPLSFLGPATVDFGNVALGGHSATATFTLVNQGIGTNQGQLTVALGGANAGEFGIVTDNCSTHAALTPNSPAGSSPPSTGSFCTVDVELAPSSVGAKSASVTITAGSSTETATVSLTGAAGQTTGIAVAPTATAPAAVDLGSVAQANVGAWTTFTITNPADASIATGALTYVLGDTTNFQLFDPNNPATPGTYPAGSCGASGSKLLAVGQPCTIQIRFTPTYTTAPSATTPRATTLTITDPLGGSPLVVPLKGTATPQITLSGTAITVVNSVQTVDFGSVATGVSAPAVITVTNNGAATTAGSLVLAITGIPAHYGIAPNSACGVGTTVAGGQTCQLTLQYTGVDPSPAASLTEAAATITIANNAQVGTDAAGLAIAAKSVQPAVLAPYGFGVGSVVDFGSVPPGTASGVLTVAFTNVGGVAATGLDLTTVEDGGGTEFAVVPESSGSCANLGGSLAPGAVCTVKVQFTPTSTGAGTRKHAVLSLLATAVSAATVDLYGTGIVVANSVYAYLKGGNTSFVSYAATPAGSATGTKAYFVLQNNLSAAAASVAANTLHLGTDPGAFTTTANAVAAPEDVWTVANIGRPGDFVLAKETDGTGVACGATLAPASSCVFSVTFKPALWVDAATLYRWAAIAVSNHAAPGGGGHGNGNILGVFGSVQQPALLSLSAATAGTVTVSGTTADFGQVLQGQTPSLTFTITNVGDVATAGAVQGVIQGTGNHGTYAVVSGSTCGSGALAAKGTCTVTVTSQTTSTVGAQTGLSLRATGTVGTESSGAFTLTASVVNPAGLVLSPAATTFADTQAGSVASLTIGVTNGSANDVAGTRQDSGVLVPTLSNTTDFSIDSDPSHTTCLNASGTYKTLTGAANTCNIVVLFSPTSAGTKTVALTVAGTPGGSVSTGTLTGNGLGDLGFTNAGNAAGTAAAPIALGTGNFTVKNSGLKATGILRESIGGTNGALFTIVDDNCYGAPLTSNATCTIQVAFLGTASATAQTASLTISDGTANNSLTAYIKVTQ